MPRANSAREACIGVSSIEPMIGHLKTEGHLDRCYLKGTARDTASALPNAVDDNSSTRPRSAEKSPVAILAALMSTPATDPEL